MFSCVKLFFSKSLRRQSRARLVSFQNEVASEAMVVYYMFNGLSESGKIYVSPAFNEMMVLARRICLARSWREIRKICPCVIRLKGNFFFTKQETLTYMVGAGGEK